MPSNTESQKGPSGRNSRPIKSQERKNSEEIGLSRPMRHIQKIAGLSPENIETGEKRHQGKSNSTVTQDVRHPKGCLFFAVKGISSSGSSYINGISGSNSSLFDGKTTGVYSHISVRLQHR